MPPIDYEAEYNNRARVPEHPGDHRGLGPRCGGLSRREAAALRHLLRAGERQIIDLFHAASRSAAAATVVFIHGGYWQALDRSFFSIWRAG